MAAFTREHRPQTLYRGRRYAVSLIHGEQEDLTYNFVPNGPPGRDGINEKEST
jgi:hypothetical protein